MTKRKRIIRKTTKANATERAAEYTYSLFSTHTLGYNLVLRSPVFLKTGIRYVAYDNNNK